MGEVITRQRGAGVGRAGKQDAAALLIGLGGGQRRRVVHHGRREIARQLDRRAQFRFVREGVPVEQVPGFEIGGVEFIPAPAERGIFPGPRAVAIGTRQALEAGRVAGGSAGIGDSGTVARDTSRLRSCRTRIGAFGRLPCRRKPGQAGDRGAAAVRGPAGAHRPGFLDLAGDLRLKLGLGVERAGHRLGGFAPHNPKAGPFAGEEPRRWWLP